MGCSPQISFKIIPPPFPPQKKRWGWIIIIFMHCILFPIGNASSRTKFNFVSWKIRKLEQVEILKLWRPITRKLSGGARGPSDAERLSRYTLSLKRQWVVLFVLWNIECYLYICNLHEKCDWFCTRSGVMRRRNWHRRSNVYLYIILRQWLILIGILQIMFEIYIYIFTLYSEVVRVTLLSWSWSYFSHGAERRSVAWFAELERESGKFYHLVNGRWQQSYRYIYGYCIIKRHWL